MSTEYQVIRQRLERLYSELVEAEKLLHPAITKLRTILGEFLGVEVPAAAPPPAPPPERPSLAIPELARPPPTVARKKTAEELLEEILAVLREGVKPARYTVHKFIVAPQPITYEGNAHDLGEDYDAVILVPTIDAQIEVDRNVDVSTPVVKAWTSLNLDNMKVRRIFYKGVTPNLQGSMNIWAFKY
jgi:hypothetical protein